MFRTHICIARGRHPCGRSHSATIFIGSALERALGRRRLCGHPDSTLGGEWPYAVAKRHCQPEQGWGWAAPTLPGWYRVCMCERCEVRGSYCVMLAHLHTHLLEAYDVYFQFCFAAKIQAG